MRSGLFARVSLVLFALLATAGAVEAQQAACTYDNCAIRLRYRGTGDRKIVGGDAALPVEDGGWWSKNVPVLAAGSDSVRFHYVEYRSHATRAGWLGLVGGVAAGVGFSLDYPENDVAVISLVSSGVILGIISSVNHSRSEEHLQRAIWLYNRDLGR